MSEIVLNAKRRENTGKGAARKYRQQDQVPVEYYSSRDDNIHLVINRKELETLIQKSYSLLNLHVDGDKKKRLCVIKELQFHPVNSSVLHADLMAVTRGEKLTINVPLVLTGTAEGVKAGGILEHIVREVEIECLPKHLPNQLEIDITKLQIGDSIRVSDLNYENIRILDDPEATVLLIEHAKIAEEPIEAEEVAEEEIPEEPEVITARKEEEEE